MKDYRTITSNNEKISMDINNSNIKQLLMSIGINPTSQVVNIVVNYLIDNNLKLTMNSLLRSLRDNLLIKSKDYRTVTSNNKIKMLNYPINNIDDFNLKMYELGYSDFTDDFLLKQIDNITINISRNSQEVQAITGYDENNGIITIPEQILETIINDIKKCNQ